MSEIIKDIDLSEKSKEEKYVEPLDSCDDPCDYYLNTGYCSHCKE